MNKYNIYFILSLITALWFAITSGAWAYLANLFISFPIGILSLLIWLYARKKDENKKRYDIVVYIWVAGILFSLVTFFIFLFKG